VLAPAALVGLGIAGLPLTGGAAAKLALKPLFDTPLLGLLAALSAAGSTLLMLHFLRRLWCSGEAASVTVDAAGFYAPNASAMDLSAVKPGDAMLTRINSSRTERSANGLLRRLLPWWLMGLAALLLPWLLLPWLGLGATQTWLALSISPADLWKAVWPLLLGALAMLALWRWGERLPQVPAGDILVWGEPLTRLLGAIGAGVERLDRGLRQWPVAGVALLILSLLFWGGVLNTH
jgi:hypothetical protein